MSDRNLEALNERERACLTHLRQAQELGVSFSRYCRERDLKFQQWAWVKRVLIRKGVIGERRPAGKAKAVDLHRYGLHRQRLRRQCVGSVIRRVGRSSARAFRKSRGCRR